jgi:hypothetical protein
MEFSKGWSIEEGGDSIGSSGPLSDEPATLRLPGVTHRLYPGPHDLAVLGDPSPRGHVLWGWVEAFVYSMA